MFGRVLMQAPKALIMPFTLAGNLWGMLNHKISNDILGNMINPEITRPVSPRGGLRGFMSRNPEAPATGETSIYGERPYPGAPTMEETAFNSVQDLVDQRTQVPDRVQ